MAVELSTTDGAACYFVTWGRIQDPVNPRPLELVIMDVASHFAVPGTAASARVCNSLQEARESLHFYEALFAFSQTRIPFGPGYEKWRAGIDALMRQGKEIYYAGAPRARGGPTS